MSLSVEDNDMNASNRDFERTWGRFSDTFLSLSKTDGNKD